MDAPVLVDIVQVGNTLGESVVWDDAQEAVWWTDIEERYLYRYRLGPQKVESFNTPERLCAFGLTREKDRLICAFESGFAFMDVKKRAVHWVARPLQGRSGIRFNDGRVDRQGRFWCGTTTEEAAAGLGALYCLDSSLAVSVRVRGIHTTNALCWSPDSASLYLADSTKRTVRVYAFDRDRGRLSAKRTFAATAEGVYPDGADVDTSGCLWNAQWGGGRIVRYTSGGKVDRELIVPTRQPTSVCFGGRELDTLFVTSARKGLSPRELTASAHAGDLFVYRTGIRGIAAPRFCGELVQ